MKTMAVARIVLQLIAVAACVGLVVWAHDAVSWGRLGLMMIGVAGLLTVLYLYNRRYR